MKSLSKYIFETLAIFLGIILSFSVDRCTRSNLEIEEIKKSVFTLIKEIDNNIIYCENHLKQLENMQKVNFIITSDITNNLKKTKLIDLHMEGYHIILIASLERETVTETLKLKNAIIKFLDLYCPNIIEDQNILFSTSFACPQCDFTIQDLSTKLLQFYLYIFSLIQYIKELLHYDTL